MAETDGNKDRRWVGGLAREGYMEGRDRLISGLRQRMVDRLSVHKRRTADLATSVASALRNVSVEQGDDKEVAALQIMAANKIDDLSRFLRASEMDELVEKVERIVRRQPPAVLLGGTFVLGFLCARYVTNFSQGSSEGLKSSHASVP
jgi:hypothetical protein